MIKFIKRVFICILFILLIFCLLVGYAFYIEPNLLVSHEYKMTNIDIQESESIKIVHFTDLHISQFYKEEQLEKLVNKINAMKPDIVVFTGDLFDNFSVYSPEGAVIEKLEAIQAKYGKYAIWGNRDYGGGAARNYQEIMELSDFVLLKNESTIVSLENGNKIFIGGIDDFLLGTPDIDTALEGMEDCVYKIILMHEPDKANLLKDKGVNLILAGHSHGGQIRIPFIKGITTSLAENYIRGLYTIDEETDLKLYVNTGIGTTRIPARFMVVPEISVFNIPAGK